MLYNLRSWNKHLLEEDQRTIDYCSVESYIRYQIEALVNIIIKINKDLDYPPDVLYSASYIFDMRPVKIKQIVRNTKK